MRPPRPGPDDGYNGGLGGVGRRPADKAWTPEVVTPVQDPPSVSGRLRRIRLRARRVREREERPAPVPWRRDLLLAGGLLALGFGVLIATARDHLRWDIGLLGVAACFGVGLFCGGRGVSTLLVSLRAARPGNRGAPGQASGRGGRWMALVQGWALAAGGVLSWILIGLPLWGESRVLLIGLFLALTLGVGLALNVGDTFCVGRRAARLLDGRHRRAAHEALWPPARRVAAQATAVVLLAIGFLAVTGHGADPDRDTVFRPGLICISAWIFGCAFFAFSLPPRRKGGRDEPR